MIRKFLILTALITIPVMGMSNSAKAHEVYPSNNGSFWSVVFGSNAEPQKHHHTHKKVVYKKHHDAHKKYGYYKHDDNRYAKKHYKKRAAYKKSHQSHYRNNHQYHKKQYKNHSSYRSSDRHYDRRYK